MNGEMIPAGSMVGTEQLGDALDKAFWEFAKKNPQIDGRVASGVLCTVFTAVMWDCFKACWKEGASSLDERFVAYVSDLLKIVVAGGHLQNGPRH